MLVARRGKTTAVRHVNLKIDDLVTGVIVETAVFGNGFFRT